MSCLIQQYVKVNMPPQETEMHVRVTGRVQGVGFRAVTYDFAVKLGLKGFVRNCTDGSVEIYAQGEEGKLSVLLERLHDYFGENHITHMNFSFHSISQKYDQFKIF